MEGFRKFYDLMNAVIGLSLIAILIIAWYCAKAWYTEGSEP